MPLSQPKGEREMAMFKNYPDVVTVKQLQEMLKISRPTVYELLRENIIPHKRIGTKYIIPKWGVKKYLLSVQKYS